MSDPVLSRKLVLEARQDTPDGMGGHAIGWVALGALWAEVTAARGREGKIAGRDISIVTWRVKVRASAQGAPSRPRPEQRFREGGRIFDILAVAEADVTGRFLECWVEEGRV